MLCEHQSLSDHCRSTFPTFFFSKKPLQIADNRIPHLSPVFSIIVSKKGKDYLPNQRCRRGNIIRKFLLGDSQLVGAIILIDNRIRSVGPGIPGISGTLSQRNQLT